MTGYAVSASLMTAYLQGCQPAAPSLDWEPGFLNADQAKQLAAAVDAIFPKTDTPSASEVGVHQFIDLMLTDCADEEEQNGFVAGLAQLDEDSKAAYGKAYAACSADQQLELLNKMNQEAGSAQTGERPFILTLKQMVLMGYFTSEEVGTNVLAYDPIPGNYDGCIPLSDVGATWAL